jgi:hypothetical protein
LAGAGGPGERAEVHALELVAEVAPVTANAGLMPNLNDGKRCPDAELK